MEQYPIKTKVVGVDISNERTTYAIVDIRGNILAEDSLVTSDYPDVNAFVTALSEHIVMLVEANGGYETIRSIGVSSPSANSVSGCVENAANLPWKGIVPLAAMLRDRLGLAVALSNDAHVTALGEYTFGSAHGMNNFIIISLAESDAPSLLRGLDRISPRIISECCDKGDKIAIEVYQRTGHMLGLGLANYASVVDPEAIIFTGGVSHAGNWLLDPVYESFEEHVFGNLKGKVKLLTSKLDDRERDVLGASALAWSVPEYSLFK